VKILVLPGSARRESLNRRLARAAARALERAGARVDPAELREFEVPLYDGDLEAERGVPPGALALRATWRARGKGAGR
jgi:NAD(P)H-dependent FMN reductase